MCSTRRLKHSNIVFLAHMLGILDPRQSLNDIVIGYKHILNVVHAVNPLC